MWRNTQAHVHVYSRMSMSMLTHVHMHAHTYYNTHTHTRVHTNTHTHYTHPYTYSSTHTRIQHTHTQDTFGRQGKGRCLHTFHQCPRHIATLRIDDTPPLAKEKHFVGMSTLVNDDTSRGYTSAGQFVNHGRHKMLRLVEKKWNLLDERFVPERVGVGGGGGGGCP
jgi:hypothetical protein